MTTPDFPPFGHCEFDVEDGFDRLPPPQPIPLFPSPPVWPPPAVVEDATLPPATPSGPFCTDDDDDVLLTTSSPPDCLCQRTIVSREESLLLTRSPNCQSKLRRTSIEVVETPGGGKRGEGEDNSGSLAVDDGDDSDDLIDAFSSLTSMDVEEDAEVDSDDDDALPLDDGSPPFNVPLRPLRASAVGVQGGGGIFTVLSKQKRRRQRKESGDVIVVQQQQRQQGSSPTPQQQQQQSSMTFFDPIVCSSVGEGFLWTVRTPFAVEFAQVIVTVSKCGHLDRFGHLHVTPQQSTGGIATDRFVCFARADSRNFHDRGFHAKVIDVSTSPSSPATEISLGFGWLSSLKPTTKLSSSSSSSSTTRNAARVVYELMVTFVPFVLVEGQTSGSSRFPLQCRNIVSKCRVCLMKVREKGRHMDPTSDISLERVSGLLLPASLWDRGLPGGGIFQEDDLVEKSLKEELPQRFLDVMARVRGEIFDNCGGFDAFWERFEREREEEEGEKQEGDADHDGTQRNLLFPPSRVEDEDLLESAVPVSAPIVNVTLGVDSKGETVVLLRSRNQGQSWFNCEANSDDPAVDVTTTTTLFCDEDSIDGILHGYPGMTDDVLWQLQRDEIFLLYARSNWFLGNQIGEGANGVVFSLANQQGEAIHVAWKRSRGGRCCDQQIRRESVVAADCQPGCAGSSSCLPPRLLSVGGEFGLLMNKGTPLSVPIPAEDDENYVITRCKILSSFASRLARLHDCGFAHLDIKLENLILPNKDSTHVHLVDFGLAVDWGICSHGVEPRGTPGYMPSRFDCDPRKIDMYSAGILAWEIWTGKRAFAQERRVASELVRRLCDDSSDLSHEGVSLIRQIAVRVFMESIREKIPDLACEDCADMPEELKSPSPMLC